MGFTPTPTSSCVVTLHPNNNCLCVIPKRYCSPPRTVPQGRQRASRKGRKARVLCDPSAHLCFMPKQSITPQSCPWCVHNTMCACMFACPHACVLAALRPHACRHTHLHHTDPYPDPYDKCTSFKCTFSRTTLLGVWWAGGVLVSVHTLAFPSRCRRVWPVPASQELQTDVCC